MTTRPTPHHSTGVCTICGRPSVGVWCGAVGTVEPCPACATDVLPALAADSVQLSGDGLLRSIDRMTAAYWRAAAMRLAREREGRA